MTLEAQMQDLTAAVRDLTRAIIRDSVVRTDIWRESTREALRVFPLSQTEIDELTGKTSPDEAAQSTATAEPESKAAEPDPEPEQPKAAQTDPDPEPDASATPSPEDVMLLGRKLVAAGMKNALGDILAQIGGKQVKGLQDAQRTQFARLAQDALDRQHEQADAA